jgi:DNA-binding NtrC family response regulator
MMGSMEPDQRTAPSRSSGIKVRTLRVDVIEGPDTGKRHIAADDRITIGTADGNDLVLTDPTVSRFHAELSIGASAIEVIDHGSTNGTYSAQARLKSGWVEPGTVLALGRTKIRVSDAEPVVLDVMESERLGALVGRSAAMRRLMKKVESTANADVSALVVGESGTGKELIARALHDLGPRRRGPFVTVDCGAIPENLIASELFGHTRGAYTGADRTQPGAFGRAHGGTIFLDEIGELPLALQPALLGVLERKRYRAVGASEESSADVRVVAATNRDLREEVNRNGFRLDLYYRIAVVTLFAPPLRERPEDVPLMVEHFLREAGHDGPVTSVFSHERLTELARHRWPGNARELRNLVEATLATGESPELGAATTPASADLPPYKDARNDVLDAFEARYVRELLGRSGGNVSQAARAARMNRSYLIELLHKHRIK